MLTPSPRIATLSVYKSRLAQPDITLRLDSNEGCAPEGLLQRLLDSPPSLLSRYPNAAALEERLAARLGVNAGRLLVTAGADDALDRICRAVLAPGRNIVLPSPTFEMLPRYAQLAGGSVTKVPWLRGGLPTRSIIDAADDNTAVVAVVSPNNPTGAVATADDLTQLRRELPRALLVVDLAYGELADVDLGALAITLADTLTVRTLSKAWGLAGLRVGYVVGPERVIDWLRRAGNPYAVSAVSLALAEAQLDDDSDMCAYVERVKRERELLCQALERLGAAPLPSQANFVLCAPASPSELCDGLAERGIAVRSWPSDPVLSRFVRITCPGDDTNMQRLVTALEEVLS
jgi:histidinol-phosphate aminotransferase